MHSFLVLAWLAITSLCTATIFEAELGTLTGYLYVDDTVAGYTGTGYVTNFTGSADELTIDVTGLTAGNYDITVVYSAIYGSKYTYVTVNGGAAVEVSFPNVTTSIWADALVGSFALTAGTNTVSIVDGWGWFLVDSIIIVPAPVALIISVNVTDGAIALAENGILNGVFVSTTTAGYLGTGYVDGFYTSTDNLTITVFSETEKLYNLIIGYAAIYGAKYTTLSLNGAGGEEISLPDTSTLASPWQNVTGGQVLLNAGNNTITFSDDWGWYFIDFIYLSPAPAPPPHNITKILVSPDPLPCTWALFNTLLAKYGSGDIFSGQADPTGVAWLEANLNVTPAIIGLDMIDYSPTRVEYQGNVSTAVEDAIAFDARGGIVAFQWHWNAPADLINNATVPWWDGFYTYTTTFNLTAALANPGGSDYALIIYDLDAIAYELLHLQRAGIPIIWRPLHEADGGWFWWGAWGPESCKQLYYIMFDRYTRHWGLRNLIWLWNSVTPSWYPGANVTDILGYDSYPAAGDHGPVSSQYTDLITLGQDEKMVTLPEVGSIPDPTILKLYYEDWSYFVTWDGVYIENDTYNSFAFKQELYADPAVLKLTDLGDWKGTKVFSTTTSTLKASSSSSSSSKTSTSTSSSTTKTTTTSSSSSTNSSLRSTTYSTTSSATSTSTTQVIYGQCGGWADCVCCRTGLQCS